MTQKSGSRDKAEALLSYISVHKDDCHVSEAMWLLGLSEEETLELIRALPVNAVPRSLARAAYPGRHAVLERRAVGEVRKYGLRPNTEVKVGRYRFDTIGFDNRNRPLLAIECGVISYKKRLREALNSVGTVLHWPYGENKPHALGHCKGCKL